jgi:hypothetical protein
MANGDSDDDLLRRARELRQKARGIAHAGVPRDSGPWHLLKRRYAWLDRLAHRTERFAGFLGPVARVLAVPLRWLWAWFRWAAYRPAGALGEAPGFSPRRLLISSALTLAALVALHMAISAAYFYGTQFEETVYVTGKQEIETGELYQFGGCTSLPCSTATDNGKFYLIESSLYFPTMFYPEENVFANIPQQDAACRVQGYGIYFRSLRWLYKSAQLYQHVFDVSCRPYTEDEIRRAVELGEIVKAE